jgi:uncharacterized protein
MIRFLLFVIFILILYLALHLIIRDMPPLRKKTGRESALEELVQDPCCQTYIPKRSALKKRISGQDYYFCTRECLKEFLRKEKP